MASVAVAEYRKWRAEHPEFPLTVHPCGQWCRKVRGKLHYFGPLSDPDSALRLWLVEKDYLLAGVTPPTHSAAVTLDGLLSAHLADVDKRIAAGKLSTKTRRDYAPLAKLFRSVHGIGLCGMPAQHLGPQHFAAVQEAIEKSGRSLRSQKNVIIAVKSVFNWGRQMGLIDEVNFGPRFTVPPLEAIESQQEETGKVRFFSRETILAALATASPKLRVAILLGINCGFYASDTIAITLDHLHLDCEVPHHDFRRVKTKRRRMAVLWPETVAAIVAYRDEHRRPVDSNERRLMITREGLPYSAKKHTIELSDSFTRSINGSRVAGVSLGSLRHTYATVVDSVPDQTAIDLTMGHTNKSLQKRVYRQLNINEQKRLKTVADAVRTWLYSTQKSCD